MSGDGDAPLGTFTDLYELTMAAAYDRAGMHHVATFELFVRSLPENRGYLVAAGIGPALDALERFRFGARDLDYLCSLGAFDDEFLDRLADFRFDGEVRAVPEGEVVFANEPILEVTGGIVGAQLVETLLLNAVSLPSLVATKASRIASACEGRRFLDFSARRDHSRQGARWAARAACVGGAAATSLVMAGRDDDLPIGGTMAHSYVQSFDDEREAFRTYARTFPSNPIFLVDTYDTLRGVDRTIEVARELAGEGVVVGAVRLDSGDLEMLAKQTRARLDAEGFASIDIVASGDLDEYRIAELVAAGAPIDGFGVGTRLGTSSDAPALGVVYKLVVGKDGPTIKLAPGKVTHPGSKQIHRFADHDVVALADEQLAAVAPARQLLHPVMRDGRRLAAPEPVTTLAERCRTAVGALPPGVGALTDPVPYRVEMSEGIEELFDRCVRELQ